MLLHWFYFLLTLHVGSTFFRCLEWSPYGNFITTTVWISKAKPYCTSIRKGRLVHHFWFFWAVMLWLLLWSSTILCFANINSMGQGKWAMNKLDTNGRANGAVNSVSKDSSPYNVIAMGSHDCNITMDHSQCKSYFCWETIFFYCRWSLPVRNFLNDLNIFYFNVGNI